MRAPDVVGSIYCSEKIIRGEGKEVIYILVIYVLLGITAIVGNTLILIALRKNNSLHQPSKALLRNLVASDLCVGFVQLVSGALGIFILQGWWQMCHLLFLVSGIASNISITVSLWTITAISVDRLLALLLKLRYRQVVTIRKVYAVSIASWVNKQCHTLVFQSQCLESTLRDKHSSVFNYIHVQLHQDFFKAASPTRSSA